MSYYSNLFSLFTYMGWGWPDCFEGVRLVTKPCNKIYKSQECHIWYYILTNTKKWCFSACIVPVLLWSLHGGASWYGSVSAVMPACHKRTEWYTTVQFFQYYVENMDTNINFSDKQLICGTRYQVDIFLKITTWIFLRIAATLILFPDGVIFDIISGSPNVST